MHFPHMTLQEFALKLGEEGDIEQLKSLVWMFPRQQWLKEFYELQLENKRNETTTVHGISRSSQVPK